MTFEVAIIGTFTFFLLNKLKKKKNPHALLSKNILTTKLEHILKALPQTKFKFDHNFHLYDFFYREIFLKVATIGIFTIVVPTHCSQIAAT